VQLSPGYVWDQTKLPGDLNGVDAGFSTIEDAIGILRDKGCATLRDYPYYVVGQDFNDVNEVLSYDPSVRPPAPTALQDQEAAVNKTSSFGSYKITSNLISTIKTELVNGNPAVISINVDVPDTTGANKYDKFRSLIEWKWKWHDPEVQIKWYGVYVTPGYYIYGPCLRFRSARHTVCVVGYDDDRRTLICVDSFTMDYNLIRNLISNLMLVTTGLPVDGIPSSDIHAGYREVSYGAAILDAYIIGDNVKPPAITPTLPGTTLINVNGWMLPSPAAKGQSYSISWSGTLYNTSPYFMLYFRLQGTSDWNPIGSGSIPPYGMSSGTAVFPAYATGVFEFGVGMADALPTSVGATITVN
jgi:hypothetical protein